MSRQSSPKESANKRRPNRTVLEVRPGVTVREDRRSGAYCRRTDLNASKASPEDIEAWFLSRSAPIFDASPEAIVKDYVVKAKEVLVKAGLPEDPRAPMGTNYYWKEGNIYDTLPRDTPLKDSAYLWRGPVESYLSEVRNLNFFDSSLVSTRLIESANCFLNRSNPEELRLRSLMEAVAENERLTIFLNISSENANHNQGRKVCDVINWLADKLLSSPAKKTARGYWESIPTHNENPNGVVEIVAGRKWRIYRDTSGGVEILCAEYQPEGGFEDELELQQIKFKTWERKLGEAKRRKNA